MAVARPVDLVAHRQRLADLGADGLETGRRAKRAGRRSAVRSDHRAILHQSHLHCSSAQFGRGEFETRGGGGLAETQEMTARPGA